jgi:hydrogenase/urease accessory protein HupE
LRSAILIALVLWPRAAAAHGMRTAYFEVSESAPGVGVATERFTLYDPSVHFSVEGCALEPRGGDPVSNRFVFALRCSSSIAGRAVSAVGLGPIVSEAVVRVALADGTVRSGLLRGDAPELQLPRAAASRLAVALQYLRLGILHIATGFDHLLFLLALALQLWSIRAVLVAESAFTLSHTLSFSATALGLVRLSPAAAEACIALSLVLLARELALGRRSTPARAALVALLFGLVHGLGFAGGLRAVGLPEHDVAVALCGFGAGVEIGQVLFLALVLALLHLGTVSARRVVVARAGGVVVGAVGAFWFFVRVGGLL